MSRSRTRMLALALVFAAAAVVVVPPAAEATRSLEVVPVDPGPIAAGRPIVGTGQNLPPLVTEHPYDAGGYFAADIRDYYGSGQARRDQRAVSRAALEWVRSWVRRSCDGDARSCRAAVVFDVDDTLLDNYAYFDGLEPPFTYDPASSVAFALSCGAVANAPVRWLYRRLDALGVALLVLSGRPRDQLAATRECLRRRGIDGWDRLVLRGAHAPDLASDFKAGQRRAWRAEGYRIAASVGDQVSDMAHGSLRRGFLLPNPMYYLP